MDDLWDSLRGEALPAVESDAPAGDAADSSDAEESLPAIADVADDPPQDPKASLVGEEGLMLKADVVPALHHPVSVLL